MSWPREKAIAGAEFGEIVREFENLSADDQYAIMLELFGVALDAAAETFLDEIT